ncbi:MULTISPECIES: DUF937 domain-containing protein [unclassified Luteimonas]|uniref:DUF937 domain-containing protein n=1 Tax=unclassified Luteimonas TaxID=2629088 RepID=UPI0018F071F7|nr:MULTISPECIES: DUF937 domain-containing protein [unclassified Luteimonas]MBJ6978261.1 DUF937 domain-containing protein [Luteimonas sp. MC1895]MBJ6983958.1 DUF937 domain-containing protein [Luteimonas sp. MC1750]QQO06772.1 DUF937 domain-containing protein [Luteimonas sp. MC1750]
MAMLTDDLAAQLQGGPASQLAQQLGISQEQSSAAIKAALPLILGALGRNASQPQGAQALFGALQKDHAGVDLGSVLGAVLGGAPQGRQTDGAGILGHIFGGQQPRAEAGVAQATGLGQGQAGQLLRILAPIVMAYLAKRMMSGGGSQQPAGAQALGGLLGREQQEIRQQGGLGGGLLGAVLDQDGDGELGLGDLVKLGGLFGRR